MKLEELKQNEIKSIVRMLYYIAEGTLTQKKIAKKVGLTESAASRFLKETKKQGWIKQILNIPEAYQEFLLPDRNQELEDRISEQFQETCLRDVFVIKTEESRVNREAAKLIGNILLSSNPLQILVGWGYTLRSIFDSLLLEASEKQKFALTQIYPLVGDFPLAHYEHEFKGENSNVRNLLKRITRNSANQNAMLFSQRVESKDEPIPITSPALMLNANEIKSKSNIDKIIQILTSMDYTLNKLYGDGINNQGVAGKSDTLITSIGSDLPEFSESIVGTELSQRKKIELGSEHCFNLAGILLDEKGNELQPPERRMIGPSFKTFHDISLKYVTQNPSSHKIGLGVLVIGFGKANEKHENKAKAIEISLNKNIINTLILNEITAKQLINES